MIDPLSILMIPAPLSLVFGLILVINRLIPILVNKFGTYLWYVKGNLLAFSFKNLIRHRQSSTRAIILISVLIGFLVFFYALPFSNLKNFETNLYYQNGAEGLATFAGGYNKTDLLFLDNNMSNSLDSYTPYVILSSQDKISGDIFIFMLVNLSTYLNSAYLNFNLGLTNSLSNDFRELHHNNRSDTDNLPVSEVKHLLTNH